MAKEAQIETFNHAKNREYAKMDLTHSGESGVVVFELFSDIAPKTCANFLTLCEGFRKTAESEVMSYEGSEVHRIVPGMFLQAGRIANHSHASIHDGEFPDESFHVKHTEIGLLGMCKRSGLKHTNESQFYVTMGAPLTFLDNQNVVFGRVIFGMEVLRQIERLETINEKAANTIVRITKAERYRAAE
jgi:cyclophilin family peptidyl-prolyl cis-trans isomerase